eukprot:Nk52_evm62s2118 gene=Nk52_evmTU62s2118
MAKLLISCLLALVVVSAVCSLAAHAEEQPNVEISVDGSSSDADHRKKPHDKPDGYKPDKPEYNDDDDYEYGKPDGSESGKPEGKPDDYGYNDDYEKPDKPKHTVKSCLSVDYLAVHKACGAVDGSLNIVGWNGTTPEYNLCSKECFYKLKYMHDCGCERSVHDWWNPKSVLCNDLKRLGHHVRMNVTHYCWKTANFTFEDFAPEDFESFEDKDEAILLKHKPGKYPSGDKPDYNDDDGKKPGDDGKPDYNDDDGKYDDGKYDDTENPTHYDKPDYDETPFNYTAIFNASLPAPSVSYQKIHDIFSYLKSGANVTNVTGSSFCHQTNFSSTAEVCGVKKEDPAFCSSDCRTTLQAMSCDCNFNGTNWVEEKVCNDILAIVPLIAEANTLICDAVADVNVTEWGNFLNDAFFGNSSNIFNNITNNNGGNSTNNYKQHGIKMKLKPLTADNFESNFKERFINSIIRILSRVIFGSARRAASDLSLQIYNLEEDANDNAVSVEFAVQGENDEFIDTTTVKRGISDNMAEIRNEFPELEEVGQPEEASSDSDDDDSGVFCDKFCIQVVAFGAAAGVLVIITAIGIFIYRRKRKARTNPGQTPQSGNIVVGKQVNPPNYLHADYLPAYGNSQNITQVPHYPTSNSDHKVSEMYPRAPPQEQKTSPSYGQTQEPSSPDVSSTILDEDRSNGSTNV